MAEPSFAWKVVGLLVLGTAVVFPAIAGLIALQQRTNPPACSGIGFGCELGPWETATLLVLLFYAPAVAALAVIVGVLSLGGDRLATARSVVALTGAVVIAGGSLVVGTAILT